MTPVDILNEEYKSIALYLSDNGQPSLSSDVNKYFKKVIVLSAASYFEHSILAVLIDFVTKETNNNHKAINFFKKKAISMQYHTFFTWGEKDNPNKPGNNANTFFSLFGEEFKSEVQNDIRGDAGLESSIKAFLEIGHLRNILVHSNFAAYNLDNKTTDEIYELYVKGFAFLQYIEKKLATGK